MAAIEAPTHSVVDVALRGLPAVLPVLDFSTIKNELFPVIATIFSKTNSLAIKVRGLQSFVFLCGGSSDPAGDDDGLDGLNREGRKTSSSSALDKYTMQEKIVPLVKAIKTKEPAVMVAALNVLRVVGRTADADFVAMELLPILWSMSLGPLLDLKQFQSFMDLIKSLSKRVEDEQTKKLQELSGSSNGASAAAAAPNEDFMAFGGLTGTAFDAANGATEDDFERLVKGRAGGGGGAAAAASSNPMDASWDDMPSASASASTVIPPGIRPPTTKSPAPAFSWSTPSPTTTSAQPPGQFGAAKAQQQAASFRTVTPDLANIGALTPSATQFSHPLQPATSNHQASSSTPSSSGSNWGGPAVGGSNPWASSSASTASTLPYGVAANSMSLPPRTTASYGQGLNSSMSSLSMNPQRPAMQPQGGSSFSLPPPPGVGSGSAGGLGGMSSSMGSGVGMGMNMNRPTAMGTGMGTGMGSMNSMGGMNSMMGHASSGNMAGGMGVGGFQQQQQPQQQQASRSGLDKYESLL